MKIDIMRGFICIADYSIVPILYFQNHKDNNNHVRKLFPSSSSENKLILLHFFVSQRSFAMIALSDIQFKVPALLCMMDT